MNEELINSAKIAFASSFSFYLKSHNFHWNVEGPAFYQYHKLFQKIYEDVYGSIDDFAENIRKSGGYVPASYTRFSTLTEIADETQILPAEEMVLVLLEDAEHMMGILKVVYDLAESAGEHGFSNFLAERIDAFRKHAWMLRATTK